MCLIYKYHTTRFGIIVPFNAYMFHMIWSGNWKGQTKHPKDIGQLIDLLLNHSSDTWRQEELPDKIISNKYVLKGTIIPSLVVWYLCIKHMFCIFYTFTKCFLQLHTILRSANYGSHQIRISDLIEIATCK